MEIEPQLGNILISTFMIIRVGNKLVQMSWKHTKDKPTKIKSHEIQENTLPPNLEHKIAY